MVDFRERERERGGRIPRCRPKLIFMFVSRALDRGALGRPIVSVFLNEGILFQSLADRNRANHCDYATTLVHGTSLEAHVPKWPRPRGFVVTITQCGERDIGAKDRRYTPAGENTAGVSGAWSGRGKKASCTLAARDFASSAPAPVSVCRTERFPLSDRERRTDGSTCQLGRRIINRDYRSSGNARWKREPPLFQRDLAEVSR